MTLLLFSVELNVQSWTTSVADGEPVKFLTKLQENSLWSRLCAQRQIVVSVTQNVKFYTTSTWKLDYFMSLISLFSPPVWKYWRKIQPASVFGPWEEVCPHSTSLLSSVYSMFLFVYLKKGQCILINMSTRVCHVNVAAVLRHVLLWLVFSPRVNRSDGINRFPHFPPCFTLHVFLKLRFHFLFLFACYYLKPQQQPESLPLSIALSGCPSN